MTLFLPTLALDFPRMNHDKKFEQKVTKDRKRKRLVPSVDRANYH